ncbi:putative methyltransferase-domain-containing protein [Cristinia sonorae]|uniref:25S rRNA adenine-N(1) methyltransferase n=1 Tax=Cristinia sonorae TaxID=1940300 RepID=A0A8K0UQ40_9AGAR|nr:putative methyltransferase-domain-containing protein [Cristinia sonorae]
MPKSKRTKRKAPVTAPSTSSAPVVQRSSNPAATRKVIRRFHVLLKRQAHIKRVLSSSSPANKDLLVELVSVEDEMERMGGLAAYQRMSTIGQGNDRGGGSEKVLVQWLRELNVHENRTGVKLSVRSRLLEVGALKPNNYAFCSSWIDCCPIDLHSQHPAIMEQDFLLLPEDENRSKWDIISLSLVLNFVPEPKDRGRMLRLAYSMLRDNGYLFVALPLPCVMNSRYLTEDLFNELMEYLSFKRLNARWKDGGKMVYWLYQKCGGPTSERRGANLKFEVKTVLRQGNRNNFTILL